MKYFNKKITVNGVKFDSQKEYEYWLVLQHREKNGEIENLRRQERYQIIPKQEGERAAHYTADFAYYDRKQDKEVVIDVKSEYTKGLADYILRRKLMLFIHGIKVIEI